MGLTIKWWVPFCLTLYYLVSFVQAVWFCCWKLTTVFLYNVSATCIMPKLDTLLKRTEYIYYGTNHHRWGVRFTSDKWRIDIFPSWLTELKSFWTKHICIRRVFKKFSHSVWRSKARDLKLCTYAFGYIHSLYARVRDSTICPRLQMTFVIVGGGLKCFVNGNSQFSVTIFLYFRKDKP